MTLPLPRRRRLSDERLWRTAVRKDSRLHTHIKNVGPLDTSSWGKRRTPFHSLIRSIIHQQVSGKAAESILKKFQGVFGNKMPTPAQVLGASVPTLRKAGLSEMKVKYIKDLAKHFNDGSINPRTLKRLSNDELIEKVTQVKGIGVWTAHMFLIFTLDRPDILPTLDLGIKKGFQIVYDLPTLPTHDEMELIAAPWRAHASLASLYLWKAADGKKK